MSSRDSSFPMADMLVTVGSMISRLLLLEKFTKEEALTYSDGQFGSERRQQFVDILFECDPITGQFRARRSLEERGLRSLSSVHPQAPLDLAEMLTEKLIGSEVLDSSEFIGWMLRHRNRALIRSAVASAAIYRPLEIAIIMSALTAHASKTAILRSRLDPYASSAQRWASAIEDTTLAVDDPSPLRRLALMSEASSYDRPGRVARRDGFVPLVLFDRIHSVGIFPQSVAKLNTTPRGVPGNLESDIVDRIRGNDWFGRVSESTISLLRLVMVDRGPTQIIDSIMVDTNSGLVERSSSVGVAESCSIDDVAFIHLGSLPSSISSALPVTVRSVDGERLISGGGQVLSRYLSEMSRVLSREASGNGARSGVSASDWSRIDRSIREPWRFVSTNRSFVDLSVVEISWTDTLSNYKSYGLWPFDGASLSVCTLDGFRQGDDDSYSVSLSADGQVVRTLELSGVPRPNAMLALERPSRIRAYVQWARTPYSVTAIVVMMLAGVLLSVAGATLAGKNLSAPLGDFYLPLSLLSTLSGPAIAYFASARGRGVGSGLKYRPQITRTILAAVVAIALIIGVLVAGRGSFLQPTLAVLTLLFGGYLAVSVVVSFFSRIVRPMRSFRALHTAYLPWAE